MTLVVIANNVRLRAGPSTDAAILAELPFGTHVEPTTDHGWRHVMLEDGTQGWVAVEYLREVPE